MPGKLTKTRLCIDTATWLAMLFLFFYLITQKLTDGAVRLGETQNISSCVCISALTMRLALNNIACHSVQKIQNGVEEIQEAYHKYNSLCF